MQRYGWVVVTCVAFAAAGACKKRSEPTGAEPVADAAASAAPDAVAVVDAGGAPAPDAALAADAGPAAPPPGGGMQLLASLMGGGMGGPGLAAPSAAPPGLGMMDLLRPAAGRALEAAEESPLAAAMSAAELASALADAKATGEAVAVPSANDAPRPAVPPYDPADPCGAFVPTLIGCIVAELGETLEEDEIARATADCRTEFARWTGAQQAKLRECMAAPNCAAKLACVTELEDAVDGDEGGGDTTGGAVIGPLPPNADFCTKLAYRTTECADLPATSELLQPQIEECRRELGSIPAEMRAQWETCFERPCAQLFECMSDVDPAELDGPGSPTSPGGLGALAGPDPAAVAALPPQVRQLCTQFAGKFDSCWDTLLGAAGGLDDPSVAGSMAGMRAELLTAVNNACLEAAIGSPQMFESMFGMFRPCFAVPCAQFQDCLMNATTGMVAP